MADEASTTRTLTDDEIVAMVPCPYCGAAVGVRCRRADMSHRSRARSAFRLPRNGHDRARLLGELAAFVRLLREDFAAVYSPVAAMNLTQTADSLLADYDRMEASRASKTTEGNDDLKTT
jgi:hypothetical protein